MTSLINRFRLIVVPYIGTWIETKVSLSEAEAKAVVPYIGTWIETQVASDWLPAPGVVPYIGTWIETILFEQSVQQL